GGEGLLALTQGGQLAFQPNAIAEGGDQQQHQHAVEDHAGHQRLPFARLEAVSTSTGASTRTAICWPLRPMRPVVRGMEPARMEISEFGVALSIRVSPTLKSSTCDRGSCCSSSTARISVPVVQSSVARWP